MQNKEELTDFQKRFNAKMNSQLVGSIVMFVTALAMFILFEMHLEGKI